MLQQKEPKDYVLATGENHTIRKFIELTFKELDIEINWEGTGQEEKGIDTKTGKTIIEVDKKYYRPTEVDLLLGDATKAGKELGWKPKIKLNDLIKIMVRSDLKKIRNRG